MGSPVAVRGDGEDVAIVQLARDRVARGDALADGELARQCSGDIGVVARLLVLLAHAVPPRLQPGPLLHSICKHVGKPAAPSCPLVPGDERYSCLPVCCLNNRLSARLQGCMVPGMPTWRTMELAEDFCVVVGPVPGRGPFVMPSGYMWGGSAGMASAPGVGR